MEELEMLSVRLNNNNTLLLKEKGNYLECQFLTGGLVHDVVPVKCQLLAATLRQESMFNLIEGANYKAFRNNFNSFSLRVKAKKLYLELSSQPAIYPQELTTVA